VLFLLEKEKYLKPYVATVARPNKVEHLVQMGNVAEAVEKQVTECVGETFTTQTSISFI
jgi:hypothetical protein